MDSHVTVNIVEPDSSILVPNTGGAEVGGLSSYETGVLGVGLIVAALVMVAAITVAIKKNNHRVFDTNKNFKVSNKRRLIFGVIVLAVLCGAFGFSATKMAEQRGEVFADEGDNRDTPGPSTLFDNTITISVSDVNLNVELEDEAVFAYAQSDIKVTSSTLGGYTIYMYADEVDLTNEKTGDKIKGLPAVTDSGELLAESGADDFENFRLTDNTWGITDIKPTAEGKDSTYWVGLPTSMENAYEIHYDEATEANDTTTIYFGTYVTPDLPHGTYEGSTITYVAIANFVEPEAVFYYYGDNVYFDEGRTQTENAVGFSLICDDETEIMNDYSGCSWMKVAGKYKDPIMGEGQTLLNDRWNIGNEFWIGRGEEELLNILNAALEDDYVLDGSYGVFGEVVDYFTITFDANGGRFIRRCDHGQEKNLKTREIIDMECEEETFSTLSVKYDVYNPAELSLSEYYDFSHDSMRFLGWSTEPNAQYPMYEERDSIPTSELLKGEEIKLYAIWGYNNVINQ
ncbi:hypothetical protein J6V85_02000 [Candidatus Saccharibacteria bacterium]|nr:hypothetical protein [Candidatus Saccharibacteria bacterium]